MKAGSLDGLMVRTLSVAFDDQDFAELEKAKEAAGLTWRAFILRCLEGKEE